MSAVLTWAVYCLAVNDDIQDVARQEVNQLCATAQDMTAADVEHMTYDIFTVCCH